MEKIRENMSKQEGNVNQIDVKVKKNLNMHFEAWTDGSANDM